MAHRITHFYLATKPTCLKCLGIWVGPLFSHCTLDFCKVLLAWADIVSPSSVLLSLCRCSDSLTGGCSQTVCVQCSLEPVCQGKNTVWAAYSFVTRSLCSIGDLLPRRQQLLHTFLQNPLPPHCQHGAVTETTGWTVSPHASMLYLRMHIPTLVRCHIRNVVWWERSLSTVTVHSGQSMDRPMLHCIGVNVFQHYNC